MHGLILKSKTDDVKVTKISGGEEVSGVIHAATLGTLAVEDRPGITIRLTAEAWTRALWRATWAPSPSRWRLPGTPTSTASGDRTQPGCIFREPRWPSGQLRQRLPHGQNHARSGTSLTSARRRRGARIELL